MMWQRLQVIVTMITLIPIPCTEEGTVRRRKKRSLLTNFVDLADIFVLPVLSMKPLLFAHHSTQPLTSKKRQKN